MPTPFFGAQPLGAASVGICRAKPPLADPNQNGPESVCSETLRSFRIQFPGQPGQPAQAMKDVSVPIVRLFKL